MKNPGIHVRILLAAFFMISVTTFALGYIGANLTHQFAQKRFADHISFLAKYLALNAELGILIDDRAMLRRLAVNLLTESDVAGVVIQDGGGQELIRVPEAFSGRLPVMEAPVFLKESREESKAFEYNGEPKDRLIGKVKISYRTVGIEQLWKTMIVYFAGIAVGLTLFSALVFYFITRSLVAPLKGLAIAAGKVAQGDFTLRAQPGNLPETRELAVAFNVMLDSLERHRRSLEKANEQMRRNRTLAEMGEFSLTIAHEFKNPLSIIRSSMDVLKKDFSIPVGNTLVFYIEDEIMRLNRLIGDFLMFARPVKPVFSRDDLNALLKDIVERFELQHNATSSGKISARIPPEACFADVDSDQLIRAFGNIIKNAFEINGSDCLVHVTAKTAADVWTAEISDNGEGIAPENIARIFNPFFTTRAKGAGLGLSYAFRAISAHDGSLSAMSGPEGGALFRVEIPLGKEGSGYDERQG